MTTTVRRAVSSRLGHVDFFNSETVSCRNSTGFTLFAILDVADLGFRAVTLAIVLPYLAVTFMAPAARAVLLKLQTLGVVTPVFNRRIVALPAVAALESDYLSNVSSFSSHNLIQHLRDYSGSYGAASLPDGEPHLCLDRNGGD